MTDATFRQRVTGFAVALAALACAHHAFAPIAAVQATPDETAMTDLDGEPKTVTIGCITWYVDYDAALAIAKKQNKPLWLHFGENPG